jgi:hypothetical protein
MPVVLDQPCRFDDANNAEGQNLAGYQEDREINPHLVPPHRLLKAGGWRDSVNQRLMERGIHLKEAAD